MQQCHTYACGHIWKVVPSELWLARGRTTPECGSQVTLHGWWNQALAPLNAKQHEIEKAGLNFVTADDQEALNRFYFPAWKAETHCWNLLVDTTCKGSLDLRGSGHGSARKVISGAQPELVAVTRLFGGEVMQSAATPISVCSENCLTLACLQLTLP
jgi:hypothetical protein